MSDGTCHVYIIAHMSGRRPVAPVKIGISTDPNGRLSNLQTANPKPLVLLCTFATPERAIAKLLEGAFHEVMGKNRLAGEWFDIDPMGAVELMCANFRTAFNRFLGDDPEALEQAAIHSGLLENEAKLQEWRVYARLRTNDNEAPTCQ